MQAISFLIQFVIYTLPNEQAKIGDMAVNLHPQRPKTVHISASNYLLLDAGLPCSNYFLKISDRLLSVVDRSGGPLPYVVTAYQIKYFNVINQLRTVAHEGNKITEQAAHYFDSRENGISFYIESIVGQAPGATVTVCVNGLSLMKL